ncbi:MAG: tetratricopeptide repeat protein [Bernardetiaceae bacterium]
MIFRYLWIILLIGWLVSAGTSTVAQTATRLDTLLATLETAQSPAEKYAANYQLYHYFIYREVPQARRYAEVLYDVSRQLEEPFKVIESTRFLGITYSFEGKLTESLPYYQEALQLAQQIEDPLEIKANLNNIGNVYFFRNRYDTARYYFQKYLDLCLQDTLTKPLALGDAYFGLAEVFYAEGNYPASLEYYQEAQERYEQGKHINALVPLHQNVSVIYDREENFVQARAEAQKAFAYAQQIDDLMSQAELLNIIAMTYIKQDDKQDSLALNILQQAQSIAEGTGRNNIQANISLSLARLYTQTGQTAEAEQSFDKAKYHFEQSEDRDGLSALLTEKAKYHILQNQYTAAQQSAQQALQLAQQIKSPLRTQQAARVLMDIEEQLGNYKQSVAYAHTYLTIKDSLFTSEKSEALGRLRATYAYSREKDSLQLVQQIKEQQFHEERTQQQQLQRRTLIALVVVGLLSLILARFYWDKRQSHQELGKVNTSLQASYALIEAQRNNILNSIAYAQQIQEAILPRIDRIQAYLPNSFIFFRPRDIVSGDFYWMGDLYQSHQKTILAAVDCTGHGVPGAFMSMIANDLLNYIVNEKQITQPSLILQQMHKEIRRALKQQSGGNRDGMDMSLVCIDWQSRTLHFAGAKNPLIYVQNNQLQQISADRHCIGGDQREKVRTFNEHALPFGEQALTFYLFSDGYADQFGGSRSKKFSIRRFRDLLLHIHSQPMPEQATLLQQTLEEWQGSEDQVDDILVMGVRL